MTDPIDEKIKAEIGTLKGDAQKDFANGQGWVKVHLVWIAAGIGLVVGGIVGYLVGMHH